MPHPDCLVDANCGRVIAADEEANRRHALEEQPAEVTQAALRVPVPSGSRVDPDLLQLDCGGGPGRRFGLEQDRVVVGPQPRAALVDLGAGPPAETFRIAVERVDPDFLAMRRRAGR